MRLAILSALVGTSLVTLGFVACGGSSDNLFIGGGDSGQSGADATGAGVDGSSVADGSSSSGDAETDATPSSDAGTDAQKTACPPLAPTSGTACTIGAVCTYGNDPRIQCRVGATCPDGGWDLTAPPCSAPPTCPATQPDVDAACASPGEVCGYGNVTCLCASCFAVCILAPTFQCTTDPPGCPSTAPNLGTACDSDASCDYGACTGGISESCVGGVWTRTFKACPG